MSTREPPRRRDEDDWLAGEGGVDWGGPDGDPEPEQPQRRTRAGLVPAGRATPRPAPDTIQRRRMLVGAAVAAAILIAIIVTVVTTGGGGGSPIAVPTTTPVTLPVTTPVTTPETTPTGSSLHVTVPTPGNLSAGDSNDQVLTLQKALKQLGADIGTPDGKFGQKTQDAVKAFQTAHGLTPDGIVGQTTADAINSALATSAG